MTDGRASRDDGTQREVDHLRHLEDGCGCAEVWEYLSERRASD